jgi:hypothetical protein
MIYAVSDVHGDLERVQAILRRTAVVDGCNNWIAGTSTFVVNGDSIDRGRNGIATYRYFKHLQEQARVDGGHLIHTMGNHDAMALSLALGNRGENALWCFRHNGGNMLEITDLIEDQELLAWVQAFPLMVKVDRWLFQHCDQFTFYWNMTQARTIEAINAEGYEKAQTFQGAWEMFYDMTDERNWKRDLRPMKPYLEHFIANKLVHGHTRNPNIDEPYWYADGLVCNIDATMSNGYRPHPNRGCILVVDSAGTDIVV